jgi:4'-phosphopantetheinyl transferase
MTTLVPAVPPAPPEIARGEIHVWRLDLRGECPGDARQVLDEEEWRRAERFRSPRDRARFLRSRVEARRLLGSYLGVPAAQVAFARGPNGKPTLDSRFALGFSFARSGDTALLAVGRGGQIGIDVEEIVARPDLRAVARSRFAAEEAASLDAVPDGDLPRAFLTCWTRKEACLKAMGTGLSVEPGTLCVGIEPDRRRIAVPDAAGESFVEVATLAAAAGCVAALAAVGGYAGARILVPPS